MARYVANIQSRRKLRWVGFAMALVSIIILTSFKELQSLGWAISVASCSIWIYDGYCSKHYARMLMECLYWIFGFWGVFNWMS